MLFVGLPAFLITRELPSLRKYTPPLKISDWLALIAVIVFTAANVYVLFEDIRAVTPAWVVFSLGVACYLSLLSVVVLALLRDIKIWRKIPKQT
jgi:hypothetical protein